MVKLLPNVKRIHKEKKGLYFVEFEADPMTNALPYPSWVSKAEVRHDLRLAWINDQKTKEFRAKWIKETMHELGIAYQDPVPEVPKHEFPSDRPQMFGYPQSIGTGRLSKDRDHTDILTSDPTVANLSTMEATPAPILTTPTIRLPWPPRSLSPVSPSRYPTQDLDCTEAWDPRHTTLWDPNRTVFWDPYRKQVWEYGWEDFTLGERLTDEEMDVFTKPVREAAKREKQPVPESRRAWCPPYSLAGAGVDQMIEMYGELPPNHTDPTVRTYAQESESASPFYGYARISEHGMCEPLEGQTAVFVNAHINPLNQEMANLLQSVESNASLRTFTHVQLGIEGDFFHWLWGFGKDPRSN